MKAAFVLLIAGSVIASGLAGCDSPDLGHQASQQELDTAKEQAKTAAESRTDLTPEQKAGLKAYYGGNAPSGPRSGPPPAAQGAPK